MNFWERVEYLLDQKDITRKELAMTVGFSPSNISKGKKENSFPSAETAVSIAHFLDTTVEYLVTGSGTNSSTAEKQNLDDLYRFSRTINLLDAIPTEKRSVIETMISDYSTSK